MNRELPLYLLGAMMIHGSVLWAWAKTPAAQIGTQKPPAVEIEISEEQAPAKDPAPAESIPRNEMPPPPQKTEDPVTQPESVPETEAAVTESPPIARPTPRVMPPRPVAPKPTSSPLPSVSHDRDAKAFASRPASGSGKDRSHASWKHRVTPSYPPSALQARKAGRVLVTVQVNSLGQATAASVTTSSGNPVLDAAAVRAARESTYHPKCVLGVPLADTVAIPYNFGIIGR